MRFFYKETEGNGGNVDYADVIIKSLDGMKKEIGEASKAAAEASKSASEGQEGLKKELTELKVKLDEADKRIGVIDAKAGEIKAQGSNKEDKSFGTLFAKAVSDNHAEIREVGAAQKARIQLKTVGNMTVAANLTGDAVATYQPGVAMVPMVKTNFRQLVPSVQSATGIYKIYRETGTEGSISVQSTPGVAKTQIDYDFTEATYNANYIAGYARIDKSMLQDLPYLQSFLPQALLRDFYKRENATFYNALTSVVTGSTTSSGANQVEKLIDYVANLLDTDFGVTAITTNARLWATLLKTKPNDYSIPGGVTIDQVGNVRILGIPVIPASWMAANKAIIGDWNEAKRVEVDGLKVEFFEQDSDNVQKNLITVRIEAREVLAIDRLDAFTFADLS